MRKDQIPIRACPMVTAKSTDEEIVMAVRLSGEIEYFSGHRMYDNPRKDERARGSWVIPNQIGESTHDDPSLLKRLKALARVGRLEMRRRSRMPRFRAK